jgi:4-amino-4-deoxy-L-arabinose transferase-like glycosyltransferase
MATTTILSSIPLFFFLGGACVLDTTLMFFVSAAFVALYRIFANGEQGPVSWSIFGAALGLGVLTKGPVAVVFVALPALVWWCLYRRQLPRTFGAWRFAGYTFAVTAAPWYLAVEWHYPGFLWYFMVKENLLRLISDEYGDRYGKGHPQPFGTVWVHALIACFPWSLVGVGVAAAHWRKLRLPADPLAGLSLCWFFVNMSLLTLTSQYTATYLSPLLPGAAVFLAVALDQVGAPKRIINWSGRFAWIVPGTAMISLIVGVVGAFLGSPLIVPILLVIGVPFAFLLRAHCNPQSMIGVTYTCAASLAYLFLSVLISLSGHVSINRSSNTTLALLADRAAKAGDGDVQIGYVGKIPFSVEVYRYQPGMEMTIVPLNELPLAVPGGRLDYLVTAPNSPSDIVAAEAGWTEIFESDKLRMLARAQK